MGMKKGYTREIVGSNVKEMMRMGHPKNQSIAAALASARKYKKMAEGGEVAQPVPVTPYEPVKDDDSGGPLGGLSGLTDMIPMSEGGMVDPEDNLTSMNENRLNSYSRVPSNEVESPSEIEEASMFAKALKNRSMKSPNQVENYAMGGLVQPEHSVPLGNKPDEDMEDDTEEPMSSMPGRSQGPEHRPVEMQPSGMGLSSEAKEALMRKKKMRRFE